MITTDNTNKDIIEFSLQPSIWMNKYYLDVYFSDGSFFGINTPLSLSNLEDLKVFLEKFLKK